MKHKTKGIWYGSPGNGEFKKWWPNGRLFMHLQAKNNKVHGFYNIWYDDGTPCAFFIYENGKVVEKLIK